MNNSSNNNSFLNAKEINTYQTSFLQSNINSIDNNMKRTVLSLKKKPTTPYKYMIGTIVYLLIFVIIIPIILLNYNYYTILAAYFPNVDMIATILGYNGGPELFGHRNVWKYLYNPSNFTILGFVSTTIMNYFALIGATFIIAMKTYKTNSWKQGWGLAFIMIICTYLAPGNIIVILQDNFNKLLTNEFNIKSFNINYVLGVLFGFIVAICIILLESLLIKETHSHIVYAIDKFVRFMHRLKILEKLI